MQPATRAQQGRAAAASRAPLRALVYSLEPPGGVGGFARRSAPLLRGGRVELLWGAQFDGERGGADLSLLERADLVVLHGLFPQPHTRPLLERIFAAGRPVLVDWEDWLLEVPESHPAHAAAERARPLLCEVLARADVAMCASAPLAALLGALHPDVALLPRSAPAEWLEREPARAAAGQGGPLLLGCIASPAHPLELAALEPALLALKQRLGPAIRLCLIGCETARLRALADTLWLPACADWNEQRRRLEELPLDLVAAPLGDALFARCASPLPWLELSALGVPGVYADREPYRAVIEHGRTGWLCGDDAQTWHDALLALLQDAPLRARLAADARARVREAHAPQCTAAAFERVYERAAGLCRASRPGVPPHALPPRELQTPTPSRADAPLEPREAGPRSSIVIPLYGRAELTEQCLHALLGGASGDSFEVIVVDNASPDATPAVLAKFGERIRVLRNTENLGFAIACNQGARAARGSELVFLNNDTIPQPGWLDALLGALEVPGVQIAGSKLLYADGTTQHAGVSMCSLAGSPYHIFQGSPGDSAAVNRRRELHMVTGACMLVRRPLFEALGGFDEIYRNSFEDVDLCLRARRRGARVLYEPRSWLYHLESQTPGRHAHDERNLRIFKERWADLRWWDEAAQYAAVGVYRRVRVYPDGAATQAFHRIRGAAAREAWWRVTSIQRRIWDEGIAALLELLQPPPLWPAEPAVLGWAVRLCTELNQPERACAFAAHIGDGFLTPDPELPAEPWTGPGPAASRPPARSPVAPAPPPAGWERALRAQFGLL